MIKLNIILFFILSIFPFQQLKSQNKSNLFSTSVTITNLDTITVATVQRSLVVNRFTNTKLYYWYRAGNIFSTYGGTNGAILDGKYKQHNTDYQLLVEGNFKKGLKDGVWKGWYPDGQIKYMQTWKNGELNGKYYYFDMQTNNKTYGKYSNNKKQGRMTIIDSDELISKYICLKGNCDSISNYSFLRRVFSF